MAFASIDPLLLVLPVMALGAYVQAVTGFAMGLIAIGTVAIGGVVPVGVMAGAVSFLSLINSSLALRGRTAFINRRTLFFIVLANIPSVGIGIWLLNYLSDENIEVLNTVLGGFILIGGILLMLRPVPRATASGWLSALGIGAVGGLFAGLFSTGGPPVVYHMYRQPFAIATVRTTLLAIFFVSSLMRIGYLAATGGLTGDILILAVASTPVVMLATAMGRRWPPPLSDLAMRRSAFGLLVMIGGVLIAA